METKFEAFLGRLETADNKAVIEAIRQGFQAITEGYGDLREAPVQANDNFSYMAAQTASSIGNDVLNFLGQSAEQRNHMFTVDDEPELDDFDTSPFNQYSEPSVIVDEMEENLGLIAGEF